MTPAEASVEIYRPTDDDLRAAIDDLLDEAGVTLGQLREQARSGRFSSEEARIAWFVASSFRDVLSTGEDGPRVRG